MESKTFTVRPGVKKKGLYRELRKLAKLAKVKPNMYIVDVLDEHVKKAKNGTAHL